MIRRLVEHVLDTVWAVTRGPIVVDHSWACPDLIEAPEPWLLLDDDVAIAVVQAEIDAELAATRAAFREAILDGLCDDAAREIDFCLDEVRAEWATKHEEGSQ